jgi:hypothetical protein
MLKRKTGRYLLTLLVITGLAGTIDNNSLSGNERKRALTLAKEDYKEFSVQLKSLPAPRWGEQLPGGHTTLRDELYHLTGSEKALWEIFKNLMNHAANPELRSRIRLTDEDVLRLAADDKICNHIHTAAVRPFNNPKKALAEFRKNRQLIIRYMKASTADLRNHVVEMPQGWMDAYQLYLFMAAHSHGHLESLKEALGGKQ